MSEFYKTSIGRKFYESDLPRLVSALEKIAIKIEEANRLEERSIMIHEKSLKHQLNEVNQKFKSNKNED